MNGKTPTRKVGASAIAGALSVIVVWALKDFGGIVAPPEISSAITTVISFVTGYWVSDPE